MASRSIRKPIGCGSLLWKFAYKRLGSPEEYLRGGGIASITLIRAKKKASRGAKKR